MNDGNVIDFEGMSALEKTRLTTCMTRLPEDYESVRNMLHQAHFFIESISRLTENGGHIDENTSANYGLPIKIMARNLSRNIGGVLCNTVSLKP